MEGVLDMLAEQVGIDGWEIRWRNALDVGDRCTTGQRMGEGVGVRATLLAVRDAYQGARYAGIACGIKNVGVGNGLPERGRAVLRPEADGTLTLFHSWTEMGQGAHTVFRQLAAAELGIPAERIRVVVDTTHELDTGETTSSRATMLGGRAVQRACAALTAALGDRGVAGLADLAGREFAGEYLVDWTTKLEAAVEEPVTHFAYGWATQVVILDDEGRIERVVAAHDVGKALNPVLLKGPGRGRRPHGPRHGADRGVPGRGRRARHRHPQVAGHHPGRRHAAGRDDPGGGAPSRRARWARRGWARRSSCRRPPPWPVRSTPTTGSAGPACR